MKDDDNMNSDTKEIQNPLGTAPVGKLMMKFAIPSIIGMLVSAMYNMIDQLFQNLVILIMLHKVLVHQQ